jgi:hypothetical protein
MKRLSFLILILLLSVKTIKAQSIGSDLITTKGNYKRQHEVFNQSKNSGEQTFKYEREPGQTRMSPSNNGKQSSMKQTGGVVLPANPIEKKSHGFFSNRNYKHQF